MTEAAASLGEMATATTRSHAPSRCEGRLYQPCKNTHTHTPQGYTPLWRQVGALFLLSWQRMWPPHPSSKAPTKGQGNFFEIGQTPTLPAVQRAMSEQMSAAAVCAATDPRVCCGNLCRYRHQGLLRQFVPLQTPGSVAAVCAATDTRACMAKRRGSASIKEFRIKRSRCRRA